MTPLRCLNLLFFTPLLLAASDNPSISAASSSFLSKILVTSCSSRATRCLKATGFTPCCRFACST